MAADHRPINARTATARACAERALDPGERLVSCGDAVFTSGRQMRRGFIVLTDRRVICLDRGVQHTHGIDLPLSGITSVRSGEGSGSGDAKRGDLTIASGAVKTHVTRIRPWENAGAIASYLRDRAHGAVR